MNKREKKNINTSMLVTIYCTIGNCFTPNSVNVVSMACSSIFLETAFISEEFCMKNCVTTAAT